jgi:Ca2+-binding EF-hand superfamily protein
MGRISNENPCGDLPPAFLSKMQLHWSKVQQAFRAMDKDRTGKIQRPEFEDLCQRFGCDMSVKEMDQV